MTRTQLNFGLAGLALVVGCWSGCYFARDNPAYDSEDDYYDYPDHDGDGIASPGDCDDNDSEVYPGANELCFDRVDNDCDGNIDVNDPECREASSSTVSMVAGTSTSSTGSGGSSAGGSSAGGSSAGGSSAGGSPGAGGSSSGGSPGTGGSSSGGSPGTGGSSSGGGGSGGN